MKRVWSGASLPDTAHLKNVLEHAGIACLIKNGELGGGIGDLPVFDAAPELWVLEDGDEARAAQILRDSARPAARGVSWRCSTCGADNEAQFGACWQCATPDRRSAQPT